MKIHGQGRLKKVLSQLNRRGFILMYHRIADTAFDPRKLCVSRRHFNEHMRVIRKYGRPVKMQEMGKNLKHFSFGRKEIVISFDDGFADNFHNASPVLEQYEIPATFFIITGVIGSHEEFYLDDLERIILMSHTLPRVFEIDISGTKYHWPIYQEGPRRELDFSQILNTIPDNGVELSRSQLYRVIAQLFSAIPLQERKEACSKMAGWAAQPLVTRPDHLPMTADQLKSLGKNRLFEIGAHTVSHPMLSSIPLKEQEEEVGRSKSDLEKILDKAVVSFAYPYGKYLPETVKLVDRLKFRNACTITGQTVARDANPFLLPRFPVFDWGGDRFEQKLHQWLA